MINLPFKLSHRLQENIWYHKKLSPRQYKKIKLLARKNTNRKQSDFSKKLLQWKKLAFFYNTLSLNTNKTLNKIFSQKDKKKSLLLNLETRIDVLLVRLYFCPTLLMARQLISHKQVCVNFQTVNVPRFSVKNGDIISIKPNILNQLKSGIQISKLQGNLSFSQRTLNLTVPNHIEVNYKTFHAVLLYEPTQIHFPYKIDLDFLF
jgi:small subunit ribosomal protein S4